MWSSAVCYGQCIGGKWRSRHWNDVSENLKSSLPFPNQHLKFLRPRCVFIGTLLKYFKGWYHKSKGFKCALILCRPSEPIPAQRWNNYLRWRLFSCVSPFKNSLLIFPNRPIELLYTCFTLYSCVLLLMLLYLWILCTGTFVSFSQTRYLQTLSFSPRSTVTRAVSEQTRSVKLWLPQSCFSLMPQTSLSCSPFDLHLDKHLVREKYFHTLILHRW